MNAVKCIPWSPVGTEAHTVEVSGRQTDQFNTETCTIKWVYVITIIIKW
jgi:hypothetical protein